MKEFLVALANEDMTMVDRAIGAIWHVGAPLSVKVICEQLEAAGYGQQNPTRMRAGLASDRRTLKGEGDSFRINPKAKAELDREFETHRKSNTQFEPDSIHAALVEISSTLGNTYEQVRRDLSDETRMSWAGTAHEIRQIVSSLLQILAPDADVVERPWFKPITTNGKPTQGQRARYILEQRGAGSREIDVVEKINLWDQLVEDLMYPYYARTSDAAHRFKEREEVIKVMRYFDAFVPDLLGI